MLLFAYVPTLGSQVCPRSELAAKRKIGKQELFDTSAHLVISLLVCQLVTPFHNLSYATKVSTSTPHLQIYTDAPKLLSLLPPALLLLLAPSFA
jgi:hypothetical protein